MSLEVERQFYDKNLEAWKKTYPGKFVVVKEASLLGTFDTMDQALTAGAAKYGLQSFLVRLVGETEQEVTIPALTLGLLSANPAYTDQRPGQSA